MRTPQVHQPGVLKQATSSSSEARSRWWCYDACMSPQSSCELCPLCFVLVQNCADPTDKRVGQRGRAVRRPDSERDIVHILHVQGPPPA